MSVVKIGMFFFSSSHSLFYQLLPALGVKKDKYFETFIPFPLFH